MIYLYGLLKAESLQEARRLLEGIPGIAGPATVSPCSSLFLVCGPHDGTEILPRRKLLLAHARVLEAVMDAGTLLPMRFGMTCASINEFSKLIDASRDEVSTALARLEGRVEIGVRVSASEETALAATLADNPDLAATRDRLAVQGHGGHYAKVEFGRALGDAVAVRRSAAQKALIGQLAPRATEYLLKAPDSDFEPLRAEFLVERQGVPAFLDLLEEAVARLAFAGAFQCKTQIIGPGPAFHFADLTIDPSVSEEAA